MGYKIRGLFMNFFDTMKAVFGAIWNMFGLQLRFGQYSFTLGAMFIGLFVISCSIALLHYLLNGD